MKVYNEEKTQELTEYDLDLGHLVTDEIVSIHYDAVASQSVSEQVAELQSQGTECEEINGKWYKVLKTYANGGKDVKEIKTIEGKDAYDDYETIQVYIPYTETELLEIEKDKLRAWRDTYFNIIDRACWYDTLTDDEKTEVKAFRLALLNITDTMTKPTVPDCVANEIKN